MKETQENLFILSVQIIWSVIKEWAVTMVNEKLSEMI